MSLRDMVLPMATDNRFATAGGGWRAAVGIRGWLRSAISQAKPRTTGVREVGSDAGGTGQAEPEREFLDDFQRVVSSIRFFAASM